MRIFKLHTYFYKMFLQSLFLISLFTSASYASNSCPASDILIDATGRITTDYTSWNDQRINNNSDIDYFKIVITSKVKIKIEINNKTSGGKKTNLDILSSNCSDVIASDDGKDYRLSSTLNPGTYYAKVSYNNGNTDYKIKAKLDKVADITIQKSVDKSSVKVDQDVTFTLTATNNGPDSSDVTITDTIPNGFNNIRVSESIGSFSCSVSGNNVTCTGSRNLTKNSTFNISIIATAITTGTYTNSAIITSKNDRSDPNLANNTDSIDVEVTEGLPVIENANDLCYEEIDTSGIACIGIGMCAGGIGCTKTYPLKNIGLTTLTKVQAYYDETGLGGSFGNNCGVDPSGSCQSKSNVDFGPIGLLGQSTEFILNNDIASNDNNNKIWTKSFVSGSCFNGEKLHAIYVKDGKKYRGKIKACGALGPTIGFDKDTYQISEDYTKADYDSSAMEVTIQLSQAVTFDTSVVYTTRDGSAIGGEDYRTTTGTAEIKAGDTVIKIYIDIFHDPAIELDEYFYIDLSSINPNDDSITYGIQSTIVTIKEQTSSSIPTCYEDNFDGSLKDWRVLKSSGGFTPTIVANRFRLTTASKQQATAVTKDYKFAAQNNLITIEFDHFAYKGTGADGFALILYDSAIGANPTPGAYGGSLGYAQLDKSGGTNPNIPGFEGGWLGLGLDEFGNYSRDAEGKNGGTSSKILHAAAIRGSGSGTTGYKYLKGTGKLNPVLWKKDIDGYSGGRFKMTIDSRDPTKLLIKLERDANRDGSYEKVVIDEFDAIGSQGITPEYIRLAVTASTGGSTAIHEIDDLIVKGVCRVYDSTQPEPTVSKSDIVNNFTGSSAYNSGSKYITTKVAGKTESFTGVYLNSSNNSALFSSPNNTYFKIVPYLSDSTCSSQEVLYDTSGNPAEILITNNQAAASINIVMPANVNKDSRIYLTSLNLQEIYDTTSQSCILNSGTGGNIYGLGQCANSESQYKLAFGQAAYERCWEANGDPCKSSNHGIGAGIYNTPYGCMMCTMSTSTSCSSDNFAIRPHSFAAFGENQYKQAGENFDITIKAVDEGNASKLGNSTYSGQGESTVLSVSGYTSQLNTLNLQAQFYQPTAAEITQMQTDTGQTDVATCSNSGVFTISNGTDSFVSGEVNASIKFSETGILDINISEKPGQEWALVDASDTPASQRYIQPSTIIYDYQDISKNSLMLFVPYTLQTTAEYNSTTSKTWVYMNDINGSNTSSTTPEMGAYISYKIVAKNKGGNITHNYTKTCFPDTNEVNCPRVNGLKLNTTFDLFLNATINASGNADLSLYTEDNNSVAVWALTKNKTLVIGNNNIKEWIAPLQFTDGIGRAKVYLNIDREKNQALNPINLKLVDINTSTSWMTNPGSPKNFTGQILNTSKSFVYGRTNSPRHRFDTNPGTAFIYYETFCNGTDIKNNTCVKSLLPNGVDSNSTDDPRWFVNKAHISMAGSTGSVAQKSTPTTSNYADATTPTGVPVASTSVTYHGDVYPYKTTMKNTPSKWLIYDKYKPDPQYNEFEVEFINGSSDWAGKHETNTTTTNVATDKTNRRTMW